MFGGKGENVDVTTFLNFESLVPRVRSFDLRQVSESEQFLADPVAFFEDRYKKSYGHANSVDMLPSHLVLFDIEEKLLKGALLDAGYAEVRVSQDWSLIS